MNRLISRLVVVGVMMSCLFIAFSPSGVSAALGDSKQQIEAYYGSAYLIQDQDRRIWQRQEWHSEFQDEVIAYGYLSSFGDWQATHWITYNDREQAVKETVLLSKDIRIREFQQYFNGMYDLVSADNSTVFTTPFFSGSQLGAIVRTETGLNSISFFMRPDHTKINMHSKISGFEVTAITAQMAKQHFTDKTWQITDNYFQSKLFFSEKLTPRATTDMIVIHHTAKDNMSVEDIHELHLNKGWAGIAYHKVILPDGSIKDGRPKNMIGAHAFGANPRSIGIVVDGDFDNKPPTAVQMDSLVRLTRELMMKYHIPIDNVVPHRDVTEGTTCPGKQFPWDELMYRLIIKG